MDADNLEQVMSPTMNSFGNSSSFQSTDRLRPDGSNYQVWSTLVRVMLEETGVISLVEEGYEEDSEANIKKDARAKRIILMSINGDLKGFLVGCKKSKEMMEKLESLFKPKTIEDALAVSHQFRSTTSKDFASIREYLNAMRLYQARLDDTDFKIEDKQLIFKCSRACHRLMAR